MTSDVLSALGRRPIHALVPPEDLGSYRGFSFTGHFKGLRQDARAWDYFLTAEPADGEPFSLHAHALSAERDALARLYGSPSIDGVLARSARMEAMWLIDHGSWDREKIHEVPVRP